MTSDDRYSLRSTLTTGEQVKPVTIWGTLKYLQAQLDVMLYESLELSSNAKVRNILEKDSRHHVQLLKTVFIDETLENMTQAMKSTVTQFNRQISEVIEKEETRTARLREKCQRIVEMQRKLDLCLMQSKKRIDRIDAVLGYSAKPKRRR